MKHIIIDAINYFYNINSYNNDDLKFKSNEYYKLMPVVYVKNKKKYYNIIAIIYNYKYWIWAWYTNIDAKYKKKTNQLINYAIDLQPINDEYIYIKKILSTPILLVNKQISSFLYYSISLYLTKVDEYIIHKHNNCEIVFGIYNIE
jgi:hypothetical protein